MMAAAKINPSAQIRRHTRYDVRIVYAIFFTLLLTACAPTPQMDVFVPPTAPAIPTTAATVISLWTPTPAPDPKFEATPTPALESEDEPTQTPEACTDNLTFLNDLTVPDGSLVDPGEHIDKQWRVQNSGTCNWDARYRLKLLDGSLSLGAEPSQQLFPARAGSEAVIQILFIAPSASGLYRSTWMAYDPDGQPFGNTIYIEFVVP